MVTNLIMWLITVFLVTMSSVTSGFRVDLTLTASNPKVVFQTPKHPGVHRAKEDITWKVSAPGNVAQLIISCVIDIIVSPHCSHAKFSFFDYDDEIPLCGRQNISRTLDGSTNIFKFTSSMCVNSAYRGVFCSISYNPNDIPTCTTPVNPECRCGEKRVPRIVGGKVASPNEYPWQAMLMNKTSLLPFCGGSLIVKQWVLSAGHCVEDENLSSFYVVLGEHNYYDVDSPTEYFDVTEIIMHENYGQNAILNNDIALLKLVNPVAFNEFISPICLPFNYKYDDFTDRIGITTGWGETILGDDDSDSKVLKEIDQKIIMPSKCTWLDGYVLLRREITESMICALAHNGGAYRGDSGGPMAWKSDSSSLYFHLGIQSMADIGGNLRNPAMCTRVSQFVDWIVSKTGAGSEFCVKI